MTTDACINTDRAARPQFGSPSCERTSWTARLDVLLLRLVDAGLVAAIFFVPLIMGGRVALGQLVLVAAAIWVAVCWCAKQSLSSRAAWIRSPADLLLLAAVALVGFQLVALPPSVLNMFCGRAGAILPLWGIDAGSSTIGAWNTLSLAPVATREAFVLLLAFAMLFLTTVQRVERVEDVERLIRWMAICTVAMAVFALAQYVAGNGKYFWFFEHPYASPSTNLAGSFTNRNHFAQFIALGIGPLVWWVQDAVRSSFHGRPEPKKGPGLICRNGPEGASHKLNLVPFSAPFDRRSSGLDAKVGLRSVALAVAVFAGLLSLSRGGAMAISVAALVAAIVLYRGSLIRGKSLLGVLGIGLLVVACLSVHGYEVVANRLDDFGSIQDLDRHHLRRKIWQANVAAMADFPLTGTGLGSHREAIPMYFQNPGEFAGRKATHAENGYLQIASEAGIPGLVLALTGIGLCVFWCATCLHREISPKVVLCLAAITPGLAASFLHSTVDFVWYVPGCMVATVLLAACACRLWQMTENRRDASHTGVCPTRVCPTRVWMSRAGWLMVTGCLVVIGFSMFHDRLAACEAEPCWHRYLLSSRHPANSGEAGYEQFLGLQAEKLSRVVDLQPSHARAHCRLAAIHLQLFNRPDDPDVHPIDVRQVREAVLASRFESAEAMGKWLRRAFGEQCQHLYGALRHARQAATLCPLQGEAYLCLAELSFLEGPNSPGKAAYVEQALKVRPFDGAVLFAAGQEAALAGSFDRAIELWKASFRAGPVFENQLLDHLAGQVPADFIFEAFKPDIRALRYIETLYGKYKRPNELRIVQQRRSQAHESEARSLDGRAAAENWVEAARIHNMLDNPSERLRCLRSAVRCDAAYYDARRALGECLYGMEQYTEAEEHLMWCLRHKPQDKQVRVLVESVVDRRLRMTKRPTVPSQTEHHGRF